MKFYVTKCALTTGIEEVEGHKGGGDMISYVKEKGGSTQYAHKEGRDWHRTREAAVKRAEAMRSLRIQSLSNQINKLKALRF